MLPNDTDNPRKLSKIKACGDFYFVSGYDLGTENLFFVFRSQPHKVGEVIKLLL
jgi:hypothetical protein